MLARTERTSDFIWKRDKQHLLGWPRVPSHIRRLVWQRGRLADQSVVRSLGGIRREVLRESVAIDVGSNVSDIPLAETEKGSLLVGGYIDARVSHAAISPPAQLLQRNATQPHDRNPQPAPPSSFAQPRCRRHSHGCCALFLLRLLRMQV